MRPFTWNCDRDYLPDGRTRSHFAVKWRNFATLEGWKPIELTPRLDSGRASIVNAPYLLDCPRYANGPIRFESTCRWNIWGKCVLPDQARGVTKRYHTAVPVPGVLTADGMLYAGAFPQLHADLLIQPHEQQVRHLTIFHAAPPGTGPVVIPFEIEADGREQPVWSPRGGFSFARGDGLRGVGFKRAKVWDSSGQQAWIKIAIRNERGRLVCRKIIPRAFFATAAYPVITDTVTTFVPDANPESSSVDGHAAVITVDETFANIRASGALSSTDSATTVNTLLTAGSSGSVYNQMNRGFYVLDTASLPDGDAITSAVWKTFGASKQDFGSQSVAICNCTTASDTSISDGDFVDNVGSTTEYATALAISTLSVSGYNTWTLNATGLAAINNTGVTKLCSRLSGDRSNTDPAMSATQAAEYANYSADDAGTTKQPELVVTHGTIEPSIVSLDPAHRPQHQSVMAM